MATISFESGGPYPRNTTITVVFWLKWNAPIEVGPYYYRFLVNGSAIPQERLSAQGSTPLPVEATFVSPNAPSCTFTVQAYDNHGQPWGNSPQSETVQLQTGIANP